MDEDKALAPLGERDKVGPAAELERPAVHARLMAVLEKRLGKDLNVVESKLTLKLVRDELRAMHEEGLMLVLPDVGMLAYEDLDDIEETRRLHGRIFIVERAEHAAALETGKFFDPTVREYGRQRW